MNGTCSWPWVPQTSSQQESSSGKRRPSDTGGGAGRQRTEDQRGIRIRRRSRAVARDRAASTELLTGQPAGLVELVDAMSIAIPPLWARKPAVGGSPSH